MPGARVFLESGLDGPLTAVETNAAGEFVLEDVIPGLSGVFAHAPGLAIDGRGINLALDEDLRGLDIRLGKPGIVSGTISSDNDRPLDGARITRAVILGSSQVGIPFAKLGPYGITEPQSDESGSFTVRSLPRGAEVGLKVAHPSYAQGVVGGVRVDGRNVSVTLTPGILLTGSVLARGRDVPIGNAMIEFRSAQPPYDTVLTTSRGDGSYAVRLRPGEWDYQAKGFSFRSPTRQRVVLDAKFPAQSMPLHVAGTGTIRGFVKDAKSGEPVANAHVLLTANGVPAAKTTTGPTGAYEFTATEGDNVVQLGLAPGYLLPPEPAQPAFLKAGITIDLLTFWVAPLPRYSLEVVDAKEDAIAGAVVRVLEPPQFGWYETNADGLVELSFATLPANGTVVGMVEHPSRPEGALFAITRDRSDDAIVQLQPLATLQGTVQNEKGAGIEGALVEASTTLQDLERTIPLWRLFTGDRGAWAWPATVPHVPVYCEAIALDENGVPTGQSDPVTSLPANPASITLNPLIIAEAKSGKTLLGRAYEWQKLPRLCGALPSNASRSPAIVVHAPAAQYSVFGESLTQVQRILQPQGVVVVLVVDGEVSCAEGPLPVLRGTPPAHGTVCVTDAHSNVVFQGFDLPPLALLQQLSPSRAR